MNTENKGLFSANLFITTANIFVTDVLHISFREPNFGIGIWLIIIANWTVWDQKICFKLTGY